MESGTGEGGGVTGVRNGAPSTMTAVSPPRRAHPAGPGAFKLEGGRINPVLSEGLRQVLGLPNTGLQGTRPARADAGNGGSRTPPVPGRDFTPFEAQQALALALARYNQPTAPPAPSTTGSLISVFYPPGALLVC
jgi:hypothetical protein